MQVNGAGKMCNEEIEQTARKMYDACPTVKPDWSQLGDVTRSVWIEMVMEQHARPGNVPEGAQPASDVQRDILGSQQGLF